ncbi:pentapeptide repeat-containing protein [Lysinibacillus agricola]|uniref:pentapeptide repeat-containing protein n=1 Tax=Lysinibacillus agricola TaxID=2590012 RepID=UPI003C16CABF
MEQLYEMIAYVAEALSHKVDSSLFNKLRLQLEQLQRATELEADALLAIEIPNYRLPVNILLLETSEQIRQSLIVKMKEKNARKYDNRGVDWMGKNLKRKDLRATNLRGAYLIAANFENADLRGVDFIGADLRDANLSGADLSTSMFLTQMQLNSAQGNHQTKLPSHLKRPSHWDH